MKISHDIRREHGDQQAEIEAGMAEKSKEFAAMRQQGLSASRGLSPERPGGLPAR